MTSFTRKLFVRDPLAEALVREGQSYQHRITYGKQTSLMQFSPAHRPVSRTFGQRVDGPKGTACRERCGHPACKSGCTLYRAGH